MGKEKRFSIITIVIISVILILSIYPVWRNDRLDMFCNAELSEGYIGEAVRGDDGSFFFYEGESGEVLSSRLYGRKKGSYTYSITYSTDAAGSYAEIFTTDMAGEDNSFPRILAHFDLTPG